MAKITAKPDVVGGTITKRSLYFTQQLAEGKYGDLHFSVGLTIDNSAIVVRLPDCTYLVEVNDIVWDVIQQHLTREGC